MAFATELTRIRIRNTGVIHLIMTVNSFSPTNLPLLLRTSSEIVFGPTKKPTKMQVKKATIGIMTLLLMKSMISRMVMPAQVMKESGPNPREDGIPITRARTATKMQADLRLQWNLSRKMDTMVSIREMEEVSAAKNDQQEEGCTYSVSKLHAVKHFRQYDEHQAWTALQDLRISAGKDEDRRDNHKAGQKSDRGIKNLDLPDRAFQICVLSHIRTISYHDTHGQRHRVEELSHGSQDCFDRNIRHLRFYIISKTVHSAIKCQAVDRDADCKKDKDRHHEFADLLNTLLYAKKDDDSSYAKEDQKPSKRLECAADETCKIVVSGCGR